MHVEKQEKTGPQTPYPSPKGLSPVGSVALIFSIWRDEFVCLCGFDVRTMPKATLT